MKETQERGIERKKKIAIGTSQKDVEKIEVIVEKDLEVEVWKDTMEGKETCIIIVGALAIQE